MNLAIPDQTFRKYMEARQNRWFPASILIRMAKTRKDQQETLEKMVAENFNPQVHLRSKYMDRLSEQTQQRTRRL